jgi:hypothetical protein
MALKALGELTAHDSLWLSSDTPPKDSGGESDPIDVLGEQMYAPRFRCLSARQCLAAKSIWQQ